VILKKSYAKPVNCFYSMIVRLLKYWINFNFVNVILVIRKYLRMLLSYAIQRLKFCGMFTRVMK